MRQASLTSRHLSRASDRHFADYLNFAVGCSSGLFGGVLFANVASGWERANKIADIS